MTRPVVGQDLAVGVDAGVDEQRLVAAPALGRPQDPAAATRTPTRNWGSVISSTVDVLAAPGSPGPTRPAPVTTGMPTATPSPEPL